MSAPTRTLASIEAMTADHAEEGYRERPEFTTAPADAGLAGLDVRAAIAGLCDEDRRLVWLRFWEGRTETESARILGISRALASHRWHNRIAPALRATLAA
jgi:DNA-directed RNA polymerase specialized sigma24 family protein